MTEESEIKITKITWYPSECIGWMKELRVDETAWRSESDFNGPVRV